MSSYYVSDEDERQIRIYANGNTLGYIDSNAAIKAIQQLSALILNQEAQIDDLKHDLKQLSFKVEDLA
jgi:hypothetical protein